MALGLVGVFLAVPFAGVVVALRRGWRQGKDRGDSRAGGATRLDPDDVTP
ncbi:hypothetical protein GGG17_11040 [Arsenicicoccus sp. MKL-02]|uniref:Uncharacterized protein n=1 Tax=Arsenicicoccus cauae TaxID=2663847 RepID=A0A6I3IVZ5_9MICO|nr:hypothetical protein [Arsenicicoccus cauae]MTB72491.1 hypothetical protein [Arsenicicoccus cauae]